MDDLRNHRSRMIWDVIFALALFSCLHFCMSIFIWIRIVWPYYGSMILPPIILLLSSLFLLLGSYFRTNAAIPLFALHALAVVSLFAFDICNHRFQLQVTLATTDYWDNGGFEHLYCTWWWYNDRWIGL